MHGQGAAIDRASLGLIRSLQAHANEQKTSQSELQRTIADAVGLLALSLSYGMNWTIDELRACKQAKVLFAAIPEYFAFFNVS